MLHGGVNSLDIETSATRLEDRCSNHGATDIT